MTGGDAMEKFWDVFWATGKVTDYLKYRLISCEASMDGADEKERENEGIRRFDRHGTYCHADR